MLELSFIFLAGFLVSLLSERVAFIFTVVSSVSLFYAWSDPFSFVTILVGLASILFSFEYLKGTPHHRRFLAFMYLFLFSSLFFLSAGNWLALYLAWELMAICSYALIIHKGTKTACLAARKAFIFNGLSSFLLLGALIIIYQTFGTFDFLLIPDIARYFILGAAIIKGALIPFTSWLTGAMEAPTPASALLHSTSLVSAGAILIHKFYPFFIDLAPFIKIFALCSFFIASVMALREEHKKTLLAYSTVASMSLLFYLFDSPYFLYAFAIHAILKATLFILAGTYAAHHDYILDLGLNPKSLTSVIVAFALLSLSGFPLLGFFWIKSGETLILAAAMFLVSLLHSAKYHLRSFSGGVQPRTGIGTRLAVMMTAFSLFFVVGTFHSGTLFYGLVFLILTPIGLKFCDYHILNRLGGVLQILFSPEMNGEPFSGFSDILNEDWFYSLFEKLKTLNSNFHSRLKSSVSNDVAYIVLALIILVMGVIIC